MSDSPFSATTVAPRRRLRRLGELLCCCLPVRQQKVDGRCVFTRFLKAEASENTALFRVSISILKLRSSLHQDKVATGIELEHIGMYSRMEVFRYSSFFISFPSLFRPRVLDSLSIWFCPVKIHLLIIFFLQKMTFIMIIFWVRELKSIQVMVRLHIFPIFSFLGKVLSFLKRDDNIFARKEIIGKKGSGQ